MPVRALQERALAEGGLALEAEQEKVEGQLLSVWELG